MNSNGIVVIYQEPNKKPELKKIKNDISEFEKLVDGSMDLIPYEDITIICKKDRKNLSPNIYVSTKFLSIGETIRGNIVITCMNNNSFYSLSKELAIKYLTFLKNASFHIKNITKKNNSFSHKKKKAFKNIERNLVSDNLEEGSYNNNQNKNVKVLQMILAIQTIILEFIQDNKN